MSVVKPTASAAFIEIDVGDGVQDSGGIIDEPEHQSGLRVRVVPGTHRSTDAS